MANGYSSGSRGQVEGTSPALSATAALIGVGVVAALYFGRDVFIPIAVAILLSFVLAIPVRILQNWGLGRRFPVAVVVLVAFAAILTIGAVVTTQLAQLAGDLPRYQSTIRDKITSLREAATGRGPLERLAEMLQELSNEISVPMKGQAAGATLAPGAPPPMRPIPVEVVGADGGPLQTIGAFVGPLLHPVATVGLVAIFVVFILLQRNDLRNRLIRLAGSHDLQRTTAAMNDAAARLSRFFLSQVLLNAGFGMVVGIGLWAIGIPSPVLWGILAAISRFIPYVGVVIAAGFPLILASAVDPNWSMLVQTAAFFAVIEFLVGQVVEPLLYGHSTGISPIAVIVSVTFWTWLWGGVGLLIATPLTVCLVVLGRHVEPLGFLDVMLGDRPPLTAAESFYQRMLAGDAGEGLEQAEGFLKEHALSTYYDEVALKGLALAQLDAARGALDDGRLERVATTISELIEELDEFDDAVPAAETRRDTKRADGDSDLDETLEKADAQVASLPVLTEATRSAAWGGDAPILCVSGRNELDRAGARMLAQLLGKHGLGARVEGPELLASKVVLPVDFVSTRMVCLSLLDTSNPVQVRYAVRRLRRRVPNARILVGSWGLDPEQAGALCEASRSDMCANRLEEALRICLDAAAADVSEEIAPAAERDAARADAA